MDHSTFTANFNFLSLFSCLAIYVCKYYFRENDLDEIAKEAGIDLSNQSEEVPDIPQPSKKEKKKKKGKVEEKNEEL